jgi:hypothetical protein
VRAAPGSSTALKIQSSKFFRGRVETVRSLELLRLINNISLFIPERIESVTKLTVAFAPQLTGWADFGDVKGFGLRGGFRF